MLKTLGGKIRTFKMEFIIMTLHCKPYLLEIYQDKLKIRNISFYTFNISCILNLFDVNLLFCVINFSFCKNFLTLID